MFAHSNSPLFREVIRSPHGQGSQSLSNPLPLPAPHNYNHEYRNPHPWCLFLNQLHLQLLLPCSCPPCYSIQTPVNTTHLTSLSLSLLNQIRAQSLLSHRHHSTPLPFRASIWKTKFLCLSC